MLSQDQINIDWQGLLDYITTDVTEPQRTQLLTLCKKFEVRLGFTPPKPKTRQTKRDIQNKLMSENPNAGNLQNILKGFI